MKEMGNTAGRRSFKSTMINGNPSADPTGLTCLFSVYEQTSCFQKMTVKLNLTISL